jgi:hypothetical protein
MRTQHSTLDGRDIISRRQRTSESEFADQVIAGPLGSATYGKGHLGFVPFFATCTNRFSQATLVIAKMNRKKEG